MSRLSNANIEGNAYQQMMGHCPDILEKWFELDSFIRFTGLLEPALKEEVRRSLAGGVGCEFCASLGAPDAASRDNKTALAVAFAQTLFENMDDLPGIDDSAFDVLKEEFSEPEIIELVCWSLFMIAAQGFGALMHVREATGAEMDEYKEWRATGEAEAA